MRVKRWAVLLVTSFAWLGAGSPVAGGAASHPMVAPYLDMGAQEPANLYAAIKHAHLKAFSAGFVIGHKCTPVWDDGVAVSKDHAVNAVVVKAKRLGATPIMSFGGQAQPELARSCTSKAKLLHAYRSVVKRFGVRYVDFDIEGDAISRGSSAASIKRRFQVIHLLEKKDPKLNVSLTVPVSPSGLDGDGVALFSAAKKYSAVVDLVNLMAMDYGTDPAPEMGTAAIQAAKHARSQLVHIYGHYSYAHLGITPMIGLNDHDNGAPDETFSLADAAKVRAWAVKHHVARLAFWAIGRDAPCTGDSMSAQDDCSSVDQQPLEFTKAFVN